jgi:uroporphyrinogen-III synthase
VNDRAGDLSGLTVLMTRPEAPHDELSTAIAVMGAVVVPVPLTQIAPPIDEAPLKDLVAQLRHGSPWAIVVFSSRHAALAVTSSSSPPPGLIVAAVGHTTAQTLREHGWAVQLTGDGGGAALAQAIVAAVDVRGRRILWPRGQDAHDALGRTLREAGAIVDEVVVYRSVDVADHAVVVAALSCPRPAALLVTSPQRARVLRRVAPVPADVAVVAIGQTTADACAAAGIPVAAVATSPAPGPVCAALVGLHTHA